MKKYIKPELIEENIELIDIILTSVNDEDDINSNEGVNIGDLFK